MKFVKAINQGITTDLGIGNHIYSITTEGTEVEDSIAAKLKDIFGHLIEVSDVETGDPVPPLEPVTVGGMLPPEGADTTVNVPATPEEPSAGEEVISSETILSNEETTLGDSEVVAEVPGDSEETVA